MNPIRKVAVGAAMLGATLTGGAIGTAFLGGTASAQSDTSTTAPAATDSSTAPAAPAAPGARADRPPRDPSQGGHMANGITEELLTGDTATQVTNAAQTAVPDGTVERVETDAEGATYEAHMEKADGTDVTVKVNADFSVAGIETGK